MALGKHSRKITPPKLIMTSMVDIFTFLLIFLLASFSDHVARFSIDGSVSLPKSAAKSDFKDNIRIVVSENTVWLGQDVVAQVKDGAVVGLDVNKPKSSVLYHKLVQCREKEEQSTTDTKEKNLILFLCDKRLSFKTINSIIKTAGLAGFPNFQFGVLKK
jgi:biopolymer transport protein ExbD